MEKCEICNYPLEKKEYYACTGWSAEDVIAETLHLKGIKLTEEEAIRILEDNSEHITSSMVEAEWRVIDDIIRKEN